MLTRLGSHRRASRFATFLLAFLALILVPALALAGPRSGGSFGGRMGFRSSGGGFSSSGGSYSGGGYGRSYGGGGSHFFFLPSWGYGGYGYGGGSFLGTLFVMAIAGVAVVAVMRAVRRGRAASWFSPGGYDDYEDEVQAQPGRAYLYKVQLALGRSGRGIQQRLEDFAARGDTNTEAGLASMLQQTSLELLREKDSIRYAQTVGQGPMSMTNAETTMNGLALAERSRFQVERVRAADGRVNKSAVAAEEGREALELIVVTLVVATRTALSDFKAVTSQDEVEKLLSQLGTVSPDGLLGLEVVWTPADPNDSMTETDVMTTYPELRGI